MPKLRRVISKADLPSFCGLRRTQIDVRVAAGEFPRATRLSEGHRAIAWLEVEIATWQARGLSGL